MTNLKKLILTNFRNHESLSLHFVDGINLIVGKNAQGKTNILESIYFLGKGRSFRASDHRDIIKWGMKESRVEALVETKGSNSRAFAQFSGNEKTFKLNGKKKRVVGMEVVLFVPQDITIFRDQPGDRRNYLNNFISDLDKFYKALNFEYQKIVTQRNRILKEIVERREAEFSSQLEVWNESLIEKGTEIILKRKFWIDRINEILPETYHYMGGIGNNAKVVYEPNLEIKLFTREMVKNSFREKLDRKKDLEFIRGITLAGPHRDDWSAAINGYNLKAYGSQSQMRMMALSVKVVEMKLKREILREPPLLLLDDVISELDDVSAKRLLAFVGEVKGQVFLTTANEESVTKEIDSQAKIFNISINKQAGKEL